ncbi:MAG: NifU family protein [Acidimicrobiia bacterium]|nr:NifU family protein [Acidimicrobiia bacterium]
MTDTILSITEDALRMIQQIRDAEPGDDEFALFIEVTGMQATQFNYELSFVPVVDAQPTDLVERIDDLALIVRQADADKLRGATINLGDDPMNPGLAIDNPNNPVSPTMPSADKAQLSGPLVEQVQHVLEHEVNPAIASHGGAARLISVEDDTVYLELMGGCQGCGMATVTLKHGIERIITEAIPEIAKVVDVTDHAGGSNPYYQQAKK